jgi:hypothetical protein
MQSPYVLNFNREVTLTRYLAVTVESAEGTESTVQQHQDSERLTTLRLGIRENPESEKCEKVRLYIRSARKPCRLLIADGLLLKAYRSGKGHDLYSKHTEKQCANRIESWRILDSSYTDAEDCQMPSTVRYGQQTLGTVMSKSFNCVII